LDQRRLALIQIHLPKKFHRHRRCEMPVALNFHATMREIHAQFAG
jgi:hypothetical protein